MIYKFIIVSREILRVISGRFGRKVSAQLLKTEAEHKDACVRIGKLMDEFIRTGEHAELDHLIILVIKSARKNHLQMAPMAPMAPMRPMRPML